MWVLSLFQNIHLHILDMSDSQKVSDFAHEFARSGKTLNVLVSQEFIYNSSYIWRGVTTLWFGLEI